MWPAVQPSVQLVGAEVRRRPARLLCLDAGARERPAGAAGARGTRLADDEILSDDSSR